MSFHLTEREPGGTVHLRPAAIPMVIAALAVPVIGALLLGTLSNLGIGIGLAVGATAVLALVVAAARARPDGPVSVAPRRDADRRVLVLATAELTPEAAAGVADAAGDADDVRLVIPVRGRQLDRWLSATDGARDDAQDALARAAGALVAAGLPVSGALGDGDPGQAIEDELGGYSADRVVVVAGVDDPDPVPQELLGRLGLPLTRVSS